MKLIIQIPCYNEAQTLPQTIEDLPRTIEGIDQIEFLVIDDGSNDDTSQVATEMGVDHLIQLHRNLGLAKAFSTGIEAALKLGADIIVNTDGDNQYCGQDVAKLIRPILDGRADMVIGDRQTDTIKHFSKTKKLLQKLGSWVVRKISGLNIPDTTSGFRAYSRKGAQQLVVFSGYTYTLETIIQAGKKGLAVSHVPIATNRELRKSRLIKSIPHYIWKSMVTMALVFLMYEALRIFVILSLILFGGGFLISLRFLYFYMVHQGQGHVQSLILAAILFILGFQSFMLGVVTNLIGNNRHLNEDIHYRLRRLEYDKVDR
ncbi:MAG: glycosyltransferase family 2 protein [Anaerolineae bacterium]|nr:glycosyltransferase family 2 protein [Anaerolineae bacterium]